MIFLLCRNKRWAVCNKGGPPALGVKVQKGTTLLKNNLTLCIRFRCIFQLTIFTCGNLRIISIHQRHYVQGYTLQCYL